jgi:hypothetical protein
MGSLDKQTDGVEALYLRSCSPTLDPHSYKNGKFKTTLRQCTPCRDARALAKNAHLAVKAIAPMPDRVSSSLNNSAAKYVNESAD